MARGGSGGGGGNPGSPNTVLVVFLVFFILATIALGVTTYMGYSDQAQMITDRDKANSDKKKADTDADWFKFQAYMGRMAAGDKLNEEDQKAFATLAGRYDSLKTSTSDPRKEDGAKAMETLRANPLLGFENNAFKTNFVDLVKDRDTTLAQTQTDLGKAKGTIAAKDKEIDEIKEAQVAQKNQFDTGLTKNLQTADAALKAKLLEKDNLRQRLADLGKENEELQAKIGQIQDDNEKLVAKMQRDIKDLKGTVEKLQGSQVAANIFDYDQPKGKIVQIDRDGSMPFVNLGSADNLRPGVTFSVYGVGVDGKPIAHDVVTIEGRPVIGADGKADKEGKATVETLAILGPHLAQVRVTSVRDASRDPILRGDMIFNPSWNPNLQQHVAISGLIDLTGEGRDDLNEFMRMLEKNRVVVDAYLDLSDVSVKGKGISRQTDYLILGDVPEIPGAAAAKDEDPRAKRLNAIIDERGKMQDEANRNGVTVISLRKFLTLSGYKVPKPTISSEGRNPAYKAPLQPKEPPKPMPMPMPEEKPGEVPPKP